MEKINNVDICCGLAWGDEAKGKIVYQLSKNKNYDFVCRWAGGNNAGHTIYVDGKKYKTHLIPSGIFFGIKSIIGPDCVVNINAFFEEIEYLKENGFDTSLIQISPRAHIITASHIKEDKERNKGSKTLGTTARGIGPCYRDKYARTGKRVMDFEDNFKGYIWDGVLYGNILCEGAQGIWLDINYGNYPYVTSSNPLPYGACSLGFPPQNIRSIYGAAKIYDTRVGEDPDFPEELLNDKELVEIGKVGEEFGVSTGRQRTVNWLNIDKLISSINLSGCTNIIISKVDILDKLRLFKFYYKENLVICKTLIEMESKIKKILETSCGLLREIKFSDNPQTI
jgi:adenylosuccinate synthase